ncbi:unnamed protein product [Merluccius merluccius]
MGCVKSKRGGDSAEEKANSAAEKSDGKAKGRSRGEKAHLVRSETGDEDAGSPTAGVHPALLEYAQRLSEEIVSRAVQQWADIDSRYSDIPYIECDVP